MDQEYILKQRCSVHTIQTVHMCWSFLYMVCCLFGNSLFDSFPLYTAYQLALRCFQSLWVFARYWASWKFKHSGVVGFFLIYWLFVFLMENEVLANDKLIPWWWWLIYSWCIYLKHHSLLFGVCTSYLVYAHSVMSRFSAPPLSSASSTTAEFKGFFHLTHNVMIIFVDL